MKQHAPVLKSDTVQRQASAHAGATAAPDGPRQRLQGEHIAELQSAQPAQLTKKHHDPTKKKYLANGVSKKQKAESAARWPSRRPTRCPSATRKRDAKPKVVVADDHARSEPPFPMRVVDEHSTRTTSNCEVHRRSVPSASG